jgi:hypothetical protein
MKAWGVKRGREKKKKEKNLSRKSLKIKYRET